MRTNVLTIVCLALAMVAGLTAMTYAQQRPGPPPPPSMDSHDPDMNSGPPGPGMGPERGDMPPQPRGMGNDRGGRHRQFSPRHAGRHGENGGAMLERLGLSDEQRQKMRDLRTNMKNTSREQRMRLVGLEDEKQTMLSSGKLDIARMEKIDEEILKISTEILKAKLKSRRDGLAVLTSEQMKKLGDGLEGGTLGAGPSSMFRGHNRRPDRFQ
jgi:periplasmic protein CpxP/Spy